MREREKEKNKSTNPPHAGSGISIQAQLVYNMTKWMCDASKPPAMHLVLWTLHIHLSHGEPCSATCSFLLLEHPPSPPPFFLAIIYILVDNLTNLDTTNHCREWNCRIPAPLLSGNSFDCILIVSSIEHTHRVYIVYCYKCECLGSFCQRIASQCLAIVMASST